MRILKFPAPLVFPVLLAAYAVHPPDKEIRKPGSFDEVKVYGRFQVSLTKGAEESVTLESEETNLNNVLTEVEGNKLKVRMKGNFFQDTKVKVFIAYKQLNEISAGAGARMDAGTINADGFVIKAGSGSEVNADITAGHLEAECMQGATLNLSGTVKSMEASVSTGGQLNGFPLICENADLKVTMGGWAKVTVKEKLDASVTMGGSITYKGMPKEVKRSDTMGGTITEVRE